MSRINWRKWLAATARCVLGLILLFSLLIALDTNIDTIMAIRIAMELAYLLLLGWAHYLREVIPRVKFDSQAAFEAGLVLSAAIYGLHRILSWGLRQKQDSSTNWRFSWTLKVTTMVLLLFAASIAAAGIAHQTGWLFGLEKWIEDKSRGRLTKELSNMKQAGIAIKLYAMDHDGKFPDALLELIPDYLPENRLLFSTASDSEPPEFFTYFRGYSESDPIDIIILASPHPSRKALRVMVQRDISGQLIKESEFQKRLQKQQSDQGKLRD